MSAETGPRVLIVDDQQLVRAGFRLILTAAGVPVVAEAATGVEAVAEAGAHHPDVVLMDVRMPAMDGIEATRRIVAEDPSCRVIMLTTFDLDRFVYDALDVGASGFLLKDVAPEYLVAAVRTVTTGDTLLAPSITRRLVERYSPSGKTNRPPNELDALTAREREILAHLGRGRSNAEIAAELVLSEATVKTHVARVFAKLQLRDRAQAVVLAYEHRLVQPGE